MPNLPILKPRQVITALEKAGFRQVRQEGQPCSIEAGKFARYCSKPSWRPESASVEVNIASSANEFGRV
jgi:hypothetical protein